MKTLSLAILSCLIGHILLQDTYDEDDYYLEDDENDDEYYYEEEYSYEYEEDCENPDEDGYCGSETVKPMFGEADQTLVSVDMGNTARLTCSVYDLGSNIISWKKGGKLMTFDNSLLVTDTRYNLSSTESSSVLTIALVSSEDAGDYECTVNTIPSISRVFTVVIKGPANVKIVDKPENRKLQVNEGETIDLNCEGSGDPLPDVKWEKENSKFLMDGESLTVENVSRHEAGTYICVGDNGFGEPAVDSIQVFVMYTPTILVNDQLLEDEGNSKQLKLLLVCSVQAFPPASVSWLKEGAEISVDTDERVSMHEEEGKHVLEIIDPNQKDDGMYQCKASNSVGQIRESLHIKKFAKLKEVAAKSISSPLPTVVSETEPVISSASAPASGLASFFLLLGAVILLAIP